MKRKGFTLIELVMTIVIAGLTLYSLLTIFITATGKSANQEALTRSLYLANSQLEIVSNLGFAGITDEAIGSFGGEFAQFSGYVAVAYVSSEALDTPVAGPTDYKKITVGVNAPGLNFGTIEVSTLVTNASN